MKHERAFFRAEHPPTDEKLSGVETVIVWFAAIIGSWAVVFWLIDLASSWRV